MAYDKIPQTPTDKFNYESEDDLLEIPSSFNTALNGSRFLAPNQSDLRKEENVSLLDPEIFRRLSISTISPINGVGSVRSISPFPPSPPTPKTAIEKWKQFLPKFWQQNQGLLYVTFSQLFGALMNVTARLLELEGEGMHPFQILFARQSITACLCTGWMWWNQVEGFPLGRRGVRALLGVRAVTGFFGIFGMYYSLQYLPVADAVVITFLAPSIASYGCHLFLHEPFPRSAQYASLLSLLGVILIAHPTSFFTSSSPSPPNIDTTNSTSTSLTEFPTPTNAQRLSAVAVAMLGVLGSAGALTSIRWIGTRAHPLLSVNHFSIFCTFISLLALTLPFPWTPDFKLPQTVRQWAMLLFLGTCGFVMQYLLTKGLAAGGRGEGARATNMIYTNMLFAMGLDRMVFGVVPGWWSLGGGGLILGSAVWVGVVKQRVSKGRNGVRDEGRCGERG